MDPRSAIIPERLKSVKRIIAVAAGKGGVGKSSVAGALALTLRDLRYRVGLLDLDFYGPSAHLILGIAGVAPKEEYGIIPPEVHGIEFMSMIYYAGEQPAPLRGLDLTNALIELLAITRWGALDFLIVDMPPGFGEMTLDVVRLLPQAEFLIVTTPSRVAHETVKKLVSLLQAVNAPVLGVVENMRRHSDPLAQALSAPRLGELPFDPHWEEALGNPQKLLRTDLIRALRAITSEFSAAGANRN